MPHNRHDAATTLRLFPSVGDLRRTASAFGNATPKSGRTRAIALAITLAVHGAALTALLWSWNKPAPPSPPEPAPLQITLVQPQPPAPQGEALGGPVTFLQPQVPHVAPPSVVLAPVTVADNSDLLTSAQLAGADRAGEGGGGGGGCDTARRVQEALRRDPLVRTSVSNAGRIGKAVMLWNGDWVQTGGQDGKGLSAVREAIVWEVAFAPEACRNQRQHGLILLSLADGTTRFAVGAGDWRWSDLLGVRR
jgi:hypothetical protein